MSALKSPVSAGPILNSLAINGRNYFRDMLLAEAIPWPVVYDHRGSFGFHTHFPDHWPEQSHSVVRPFQPICVQVLGQVIRETGIVGVQVGGNGSSVIYPVWIERWDFQRCILVHVPVDRVWEPVMRTWRYDIPRFEAPLVSPSAMMVACRVPSTRIFRLAPEMPDTSATIFAEGILEGEERKNVDYSKNRPTIAFLTS